MRFIGQTLRNMNRLSFEKSPYLLQHKTNPINWYPWGKEAFEKAKNENLPIFLSVGYSTCHWCHVMEKESFENQDTAKILNENFVSIKVDREERPDVDKLYMAFVVAVSGHGGWPMSVFLTPDLAPITGGTYFPPDDSRGMMGFPTILKMISGEWKNDHENLKKQGSIVLGLLKTEQTQAGDVNDSDEVYEALYSHKNSTFDSRFGGFGKAPKFPKASDLDFLISFAAANRNESSEKCSNTIQMLSNTLESMSHGGIHDHIAGGFHRYSVDAEWHVPHFEKMLYDQAQLLTVYSDFYRLKKGDEECRKVIEDIYEYLMRELRHPEGAFYSAQDADSFPNNSAEKKVEGAFAVWEKAEIRALLNDPVFDIFCEYFDVEDDGNVASDPHGEFHNKNVLRRLLTDQECATNFNLQIPELKIIIEDAKKILLEARTKRPAPHLDSKMVCAWQGLAISGLVKAYQALGDVKYLDAAESCRKFVEKYLQDNESGELRRSVYLANDGENVEFGPDVIAFSDDYAFLIQGLLDVYTVTGNDKVLRNANRLQTIMDEKFWNGRGYYVSEENDESGVGVRMVEDQDGAEPCATSIATNNLLRLYDILENETYRDNANLCLRGASERLNKIPIALPKLAQAHRRWQNGSTTFVLVGESDSELLEVTNKMLNKTLISNLSVVHIHKDDDLSSSGASHGAMLQGPKPAVYICSGFVCSRPVRTVSEMLEKFEKDF